MINIDKLCIIVPIYKIFESIGAVLVMLKMSDGLLSSVAIESWSVLDVKPWSIVVKFVTQSHVGIETLGRTNEFVLRWVRENSSNNELLAHKRASENSSFVVRAIAGTSGLYKLGDLVPTLSDEQCKKLIREINVKGGKIDNEVGGRRTLDDDGEWLDPVTRGSSQIALELEAMHGSLDNFFYGFSSEIKPEVLRLAKKDCSEACEDLHRLGIIHGDLWPRNVFFRDEDGGLVFKIGDFGLSKLSVNDQNKLEDNGFSALKSHLEKAARKNPRKTKRSYIESGDPHSPSKLGAALKYRKENEK